MTKVRVHEYAKRVKKTSKEVIDELEKNNVTVTNHMSTIEPSVITKLDKSFGVKTESKAAPQAKSTSPKTAQKNTSSTTSGQKRPATTGTPSRPATTGQGGQSRPSSGGPSRPAATGQGGQTPRPSGGRPASAGRRGGRPPARGINQGRRRYRPANVPKVQMPLPEKITFYESLSVAELARKLGREPSELLKKLLMLGVMATINEELDQDAIELIYFI